MMAEWDYVGSYYRLCAVLDEGVAAAVVHGWAHIETFVPQKSHDQCVAHLMCAMTLLLGGPRGVALKFKGSLTYS